MYRLLIIGCVVLCGSRSCLASSERTREAYELVCGQSVQKAKALERASYWAGMQRNALQCMYRGDLGSGCCRAGFWCQRGHDSCVVGGVRCCAQGCCAGDGCCREVVAASEAPLTVSEELYVLQVGHYVEGVIGAGSFFGGVVSLVVQVGWHVTGVVGYVVGGVGVCVGSALMVLGGCGGCCPTLSEENSGVLYQRSWEGRGQQSVTIPIEPFTGHNG